VNESLMFTGALRHSRPAQMATTCEVEAQCDPLETEQVPAIAVGDVFVEQNENFLYRAYSRRSQCRPVHRRRRTAWFCSSSARSAPCTSACWQRKAHIRPLNRVQRVSARRIIVTDGLPP